MGNRSYNILWLLFLPVIGSLRAEKAAWLEPQADVRLLMKTESGQGRHLLIPVPQELQQLTAVAARDAQGVRLAARPVFCQNKMPAVVIDWERQKMLPGVEFQLYFHESTPAEAVPAPAGQAVVRLDRTTARLTTRPHDAAEMIRLFGSPPVQSRLFVHSQVEALGVPHERFHKQERTPERRQVATLFHWSASFLLETERELVFSAPPSGAAWELLIDADSAGGWQLPAGPRRYAAGLHAIQLLAVAYADESLPELTVSSQGSGFSLSLLPPLEHQPVSARFERRDSDVSWVWGAGKRQRWHVPQTGVTVQRGADHGRLQGVRILPSIFPPDFSPLVAVSGSQDEQDDGASWSFTMAPDWRVWMPAPSLFCRVQWHILQQLLAARHSLRGRLTVRDEPPLPPELRQDIQLRISQFNADGEELGSVRLAPAADGYELDLPLDPGVVRLTVTPLLAGTMLAWPEEIWVLTPESPLSGVRRHGLWLRQGDTLAVLRCRPLQKLTLPAVPRRQPPVLLVPDDRRGRGQAEQRGFDAQLAQASGMRIKRLPFAGFAGGSQDLPFPAMLETLAVQEADYLLLDPGADRLRGGLPLATLTQEILFAAQAAAHRQVTPVLLLPPPARIERPAALRLKELAFALGMPVCDLYSAELRDPLDMVSWFRDRAGEYLLPSAVGQSWLAQSLAEALRRSLPERGGQP